MSNRPRPIERTTWLATREDQEHLSAIAAALRSQAGEPWPTRTGALRYALRVVAAHLQATGRLPQVSR